MTNRPEHPSKRPVRREQKRGRGYWNAPNNGPVTPRLQQPQPKDAIGFHHYDSHRPDYENDCWNGMKPPQ